MRLFKIFFIGMIGLLVGVGIFQLDTYGHFERWKKLTNPSADILNLFETERSSGGNGVEITKPCNFSTPEFSFLSNHPKSIVDCIQKLERAADAYIQSTYVKDNEGTMWEWGFFSYAYVENLNMFLYPVLGFTGGLAIAFHFQKRV